MSIAMWIRKIAGRIKEELIQIIEIVSCKNSYVHIGIKPRGKIMNGNVGDPILYILVEEIWSKILEDSNRESPNWIHRDIRHRLTKFHVWLYNKFAKKVIIGGGGLFMADLPWAKNSGWLFDTKKEYISALNIPIIVFAVGFNVFRNLSEFNRKFKSHLNTTVNKSLLFGLRNYGSINSILGYLTKENKNKIIFQPCPTTFLSQYQEVKKTENANKIGICLAFDRFESRFPTPFSEIISQIDIIEQRLKDKGYDVVYFIHSSDDIKSEHFKELNQRKNIKLVSEKTKVEILNFYSDKKVIIGMRGHSLMIPFGMKIPVISLTTQDKQKFFMELINHPERSIEVSDRNLSEKVINQMNIILENYDKEVSEIDSQQKEFYELTIKNIASIEGI